MQPQHIRKGMLLIVSGPSGAGKGTLCQRLLENDPSFRFSCSVTTRQPRRNEIDGVHYHFVTEEAYRRLVAEDAFLEHATVHGHHYGTMCQPVEEMMAQGMNVLLDIDSQGALNVMRTAREYVSVFIAPPAVEELRVRLCMRNTDGPEEIERRLNNARAELKRIGCYQYVIINDQLELAYAQLQAIVTAEKQRTTRFQPCIPESRR